MSTFEDCMTKPSLCVLGSVNLDLIIQTAVLPKAGQTITGGKFSSLPGGKGGNVALAAQRLGAQVELRGAVGQDSYADEALEFLRHEGVNLDQLVRLEDASTGLAFINVADDGENQIAVASGANAAFGPEHLKPIKSMAIFTQFEIPIDTIEAALKGFDGFVSVNASPVLPGLDRIVHYADLIIVNEGEYAAYQKELKAFTGYLAITLGSQGAKLLQGHDTIAEARPPKIDVVDTTGAGDAFAAALTVAFLKGQSPQTALDFACHVGALTTTKLGTQSAAPFHEDVMTLLAQSSL
jgi:ribokinase